MKYSALNRILGIIGIPILIVIGIVIYKIRRHSHTENFEDGEFTKGEEDLYKRISEGLNEKIGELGSTNTSCTDKTKFLDNKILKRAYGANASSDCVRIATQMCESTRPEMFKVEGHYFPPRHLSKTYKDAPLPTFTKLGCFDMHYGCCLQTNKEGQY